MLCRRMQGWNREIEGSSGLPDGANWVGLEMSVQFSRRMGGPANSGDTILIRLKEIDEPRGGLKCLLSRYRNSLEKEHKPSLPVTVFPDLVEQVVIEASVRFKEQTQVKQRLAKGSFRAKQQGNQEASNPPVAVEEWMDRLKLNVRQRCLE